MKVLACPICGSKRLGLLAEALRLPYIGYTVCYDCENYVIPLATPQEVT